MGVSTLTSDPDATDWEFQPMQHHLDRQHARPGRLRPDQKIQSYTRA